MTIPLARQDTFCDVTSRTQHALQEKQSGGQKMQLCTRPDLTPNFLQVPSVYYDSVQCRSRDAGERNPGLSKTDLSFPDSTTCYPGYVAIAWAQPDEIPCG